LNHSGASLVSVSGTSRVTLPGTLPVAPLFLQLASADAGSSNGMFTLSNGVRVDVQ
jgi:hypothetical protein